MLGVRQVLWKEGLGPGTPQLDKSERLYGKERAGVSGQDCHLSPTCPELTLSNLKKAPEIS